MFCYKCGTKLPDDAMFCFKCGTKVPEQSYSEPNFNPSDVVINDEDNNFGSEPIFDFSNFNYSALFTDEVENSVHEQPTPPDSQFEFYGLENVSRGFRKCWFYNGQIYASTCSGTIFTVKYEDSKYQKFAEPPKNCPECLDIWVNDKGVFAITAKDSASGINTWGVFHYDHSGNLLNKFTLVKTKQEFYYYILGSKIYYPKKGYLMYFDTSDGYERNTDIKCTNNQIFVSEKFFTFKTQKGWTVYNRTNNSSKVIDETDKKKVFRFDMKKNIVWIVDKNKNQVIPYNLENLCQNYDISLWNVKDTAFFSYNSSDFPCFFNGEILYYSSTYYELYSYSPDGDKYAWATYCNNDVQHTQYTKKNGGHGNCQYFVVLGDKLFSDSDTYGSKMYQADIEPSQEIQDFSIRKITGAYA